eukprot:COSAG02_NODE_1747_length_11077_cov_31.871470_5_plen_498_part_00
MGPRCADADKTLLNKPLLASGAADQRHGLGRGYFGGFDGEVAVLGYATLAIFATWNDDVDKPDTHNDACWEAFTQRYFAEAHRCWNSGTVPNINESRDASLWSAGREVPQDRWCMCWWFVLTIISIVNVVLLWRASYSQHRQATGMIEQSSGSPAATLEIAASKRPKNGGLTPQSFKTANKSDVDFSRWVVTEAAKRLEQLPSVQAEITTAEEEQPTGIPAAEEEQDDASYMRQMHLCASVFVAACFLRAVWPRVDVERICFWGDGVLSTTLCGRSAAFAAEMCLAWQFSTVLGKINMDVQAHVRCRQRSHTGFTLVHRVSQIVFPALTVAQLCCWCGVLTMRQLWHVFEETLWMANVFLMTISCIFLAVALRWIDPAVVTAWPAKQQEQLRQMRLFIHSFVPLGGIFVVFMLAVDIPMYMQRYQADEERGAAYLWISDGLVDAMSCRDVRRDLEIWAEEMPWMTAYFCCTVWVSIWMVRSPSLSRYSRRKELSASK